MKNGRQKSNSNRRRDAPNASSAKRQGARAGGESGSDESTRADAGRRASANAFRAGRDAGLGSEPERERVRAVAPDGERAADSGSGGDSGGGDSGGSSGGRGRRGRGRPKRDAGSGNTSGDHTDADQGAESSTEDVVREVAEEDKPLKNRPKGKRKAKGGSMKGAMVMVLGQASAAIFTCVAMLTNHDHWSLEREESEKLGKALNDALSTLPERAYEKVIAIAEKWHPWVHLIFVLGILVWTRIEESSKLAQSAQEPNYQAGDGSVNGNRRPGQGAAQANYRPYHSSLGYDN